MLTLKWKSGTPHRHDLYFVAISNAPNGDVFDFVSWSDGHWAVDASAKVVAFIEMGDFFRQLNLNWPVEVEDEEEVYDRPYKPRKINESEFRLHIPDIEGVQIEHLILAIRTIAEKLDILRAAILPLTGPLTSLHLDYVRCAKTANTLKNSYQLTRAERPQLPSYAQLLDKIAAENTE